MTKEELKQENQDLRRKLAAYKTAAPSLSMAKRLDYQFKALATERDELKAKVKYFERYITLGEVWDDYLNGAWKDEQDKK